MKEFTNCLAQKGEGIILKDDFRNDHEVIYWNLIFYFKLFKLPDFFLDLDYSAHHVLSQVEKLTMYEPVPIKSKAPVPSNRKSSLNSEALKKLNDANKESIPTDHFTQTANLRPPSLQDGMAAGGFASDSIGVDSLSHADGGPRQRRPGSVVNFGGRGSSARRSRRGSISQRSGSGS